jgi:hypothetical protein
MLTPTIFDFTSVSLYCQPLAYSFIYFLCTKLRPPPQLPCIHPQGQTMAHSWKLNTTYTAGIFNWVSLVRIVGGAWLQHHQLAAVLSQCIIECLLDDIWNFMDQWNGKRRQFGDVALRYTWKVTEMVVWLRLKKSHSLKWLCLLIVLLLIYDSHFCIYHTLSYKHPVQLQVVTLPEILPFVHGRPDEPYF